MLALTLVLLMSLTFCFSAFASVSSTLIALTKNDGIYLIELSAGVRKSEEKVYDGAAEMPQFSQDGKSLAFFADDLLYVCDIATSKSESVGKNPENWVAFAWGGDGALYAAAKDGGLYAYKDKKLTEVADPKYHYAYLVYANGKLYASKMYYVEKEDGQYQYDVGLIRLDPASKKQKLVVADRPADWESENGTAGMIPMTAGASSDGRYIYVFMHYHAGSLSADGVPFGAYDTVAGKFLAYPDAGLTLVDNANVVGNEKNPQQIALQTVYDRYPWNGRDIVLLNLETGKSKSLTQKGGISIDPAFSLDGKTLYYSAANWKVDVKDWQKGRDAYLAPGSQSIYKLELATGKRTKLTAPKNGADVCPIPTNDGVLFTRVFDYGKDGQAQELWLIGKTSSRRIVSRFPGLYHESLFMDVFNAAL